jgi:uncharacterized protein YdhG (YjbR/CyaY superfamily)
VMKANRAALGKYVTTAGGVHFSPEAPLPAALVRRLVLARVRENEGRRRLRGAKGRRGARALA